MALLFVSCAKRSTVLLDETGSLTVFADAVRSVERTSYVAGQYLSATYSFTSDGRLEQALLELPFADAPLLMSYSYSHDSVLVRTVYPDGFVDAVSYAASFGRHHRLRTRKDDWGGKMSCEYDIFGNPKRVRFSQDGQTTRSISLSYDLLNRLSSVSDLTSTGPLAPYRSLTTYDHSGRPIRTTCTSLSDTVVLSYSDYQLDSHGNWLSRTVSSSTSGSFVESRSVVYY